MLPSLSSVERSHSLFWWTDFVSAQNKNVQQLAEKKYSIYLFPAYSGSIKFPEGQFTVLTSATEYTPYEFGTTLKCLLPWLSEVFFHFEFLPAAR